MDGYGVVSGQGGGPGQVLCPTLEDLRGTAHHAVARGISQVDGYEGVGGGEFSDEHRSGGGGWSRGLRIEVGHHLFDAEASVVEAGPAVTY